MAVKSIARTHKLVTDFTSMFLSRVVVARVVIQLELVEEGFPTMLTLEVALDDMEELAVLLESSWNGEMFAAVLTHEGTVTLVMFLTVCCQFSRTLQHKATLLKQEEIVFFRTSNLHHGDHSWKVQLGNNQR